MGALWSENDALGVTTAVNRGLLHQMDGRGGSGVGGVAAGGMDCRASLAMTGTEGALTRVGAHGFVYSIGPAGSAALAIVFKRVQQRVKPDDQQQRA